MKIQWINRVVGASLFLSVFCVLNGSFAVEAAAHEVGEDKVSAWRSGVVEYARIMSQVQWTPVDSPVSDGIPRREKNKFFEAGTIYTGVPYSNGGLDGRYIGFEIFLKTFLAALENPHSVLYTEDVRGQRRNAGAYYGMVCSTFTSYALQYAHMFSSTAHVAPHQEGIIRVDPQSAQAAEIGDIIRRPGHVEIVTGITRSGDGSVTHVLVVDSSAPTPRTINRAAVDFDNHITSGRRALYRITDLDAWRGDGIPDSFMFPNYEEDSVTPVINRVLLLDRGDWVPYHKGQTVKFNVMDRDGRGIKSLVIKREGDVLETIDVDGPGIIERIFSVSGDYIAYCVMKDGAMSQACEFSVCALDSSPVSETITLGEPWEIEFNAENMNVILVGIFRGGTRGSWKGSPYIAHYHIWVTDQDREKGRVVVPGDVFPQSGDFSFVVHGENRYGRLRSRQLITVEE